MTSTSLQAYVVRLAERMEGRYGKAVEEKAWARALASTSEALGRHGFIFSANIERIIKEPVGSQGRFGYATCHQDAVAQFWQKNGPGKIDLTPPTPKQRRAQGSPLEFVRNLATQLDADMMRRYQQSQQPIIPSPPLEDHSPIRQTGDALFGTPVRITGSITVPLEGGPS